MTRKKISEAELKVTPQRVMVYELMQSLYHAPTDVIVKKIQEKNPAITVSTIYRILDSFLAAGLLSKIVHPDGKVYYDINTHEHHHIFSEDNRIVDVEDDELTEIIKRRIADKLGSNEHIKRIAIQIITSDK